MFCDMYTWCVLFTSFFEQLQESKYVAFLVFGFYIVHGFGSLLLRMVANQVDRALAAGCASMNIIMRLVADTFSWHVYELWYVVRRKEFVEGERSIISDGVGGLCYVYNTTHFWYPGRLFVSKNALYLAYKFVLRITSSISYLLFSSLLRYGYNSPPYYTEASYSEQTFQNLMYFFKHLVLILL